LYETFVCVVLKYI